jgi:hypothetical protein
MVRKGIYLFISLLPCLASAAVYECADGKYQAEPCDAKSRPIDLRGVGSTISSNPPKSNLSLVPNAITSSTENKRAEITSYIHQQQIKRDIKQLESERRSVFKRWDAKIKELRVRGLSANNNLAGATWQQSLAQEMSAVMQQADTAVKSIDSRIESLNRDLK